MRGQGRVFKRGSTWWIAYSNHGKEHRESSGSTKESDARKLLRRRLGEIHAGTFTEPQAQRLTAGDLLDALEEHYEINRRKGTKVFRYQVKPVRKALGDLRAAEISARVLERYQKARLEAGKAPATVNKELGALRTAFRLAHRQGRLRAVPYFPHLREDNARQGFVEPEAFERIAAELPRDVEDFARFGYLSGWRRGEIRSLTWRDVDIEQGLIYLRSENSKNGRPRMVPLEGALRELIARREKLRVVEAPGGPRLAEYVFHRDGAPLKSFDGAWKAATTAAGLEGTLFHDLRRSAVRNMTRAGVPEKVAMEISGHRTRSMFDRYNITDEGDLRAALERTESYIEEQKTRRRVIDLPKAASPGA